MRHARSHSQLADYLHCGHAFYLKRVAKKPGRPSVWLPGGKAFHSVTEAFDRETWQADSLDISDADVALWQDEFTVAFEAELDELRATDPDESTWRAAGRVTKDKPNKEDVTWWHTAGREMTEKYLRWREASCSTWAIADLGGEPGIEIEVTQSLGVPMRGYVDRLFRSREDGRLLVMDLKSGSRTPISPMQLATYSLQLEELLGEPVLWGAFYRARDGVLGQPINLSRFTSPLLSGVYDGLDRAVEAGIFLPHIDTFCVSCEVQNFCVFMGGTENPPQGVE